MPIQTQYFPYSLDFTFDAGTSRGILRNKTSWFIRLQDSSGNTGWGEAGPLPGLSVDESADFPALFDEISRKLKHGDPPSTEHDALHLASELVSDAFPSVKFALEVALLGLVSGDSARIISGNSFIQGEKIPINGLIWMGDTPFMKRQFLSKLADDYTCFKMKIGALEFNRELEVLGFMRATTDAILRVDANGAFSPAEAMDKLSTLAEYRLHSIEQPLKAGQPEAMADLCRNSPVPIALDEELIGIPEDSRKELLEFIRPEFIILKPTLLGGISATRNWVAIAESLGIGWWITSALESNIGLNAICQLTDSLKYTGHQGLGTGQLYSNNIPGPLEVSSGHIYYNAQKTWKYP